jgi:hypothetical protein
VSRLDEVIARLSAQRALLDWACADLPPGPALELGLGNGRTYDHLRDRLGPARAIHVFDREMKADPRSVPPAAFFHLGDIARTLPDWAARHPRAAVLAHADIGSHDPAATKAFAALLARLLGPCLAPGAIVLCDQALADPALIPDAAAPPGVYHAYRAR